jgi:hypothetical protein
MAKVIIENLKRKIVDEAAKQGVMALEPDLKFTPIQIGTAVQAAGAGVPGGASDPTIPGAAQAAQQAGLNPDGTPQQSQQPTAPTTPPPQVTTYKDAQGQLVTPNGQSIDPNHFYSIQELAAMGLSPQNLQAEAARAQQQQTPLPGSAQQPQQPQQPMPQQPQAPQPSQMPQQPAPQLPQ